MKKPLPFILDNNGKLELNQEVMNEIKKSNNPRFILFYGKTRLGKSTTLNQLIRGNIKTWKYINQKPFNSNNTLNSITKGCDIFGPIKISEIFKNHEGLKNKEVKEDFDVFFCDTESISSLNGIQKKTISGILTLLQICAISVFMVNRNFTLYDFNEICSQMQLAKIINLASPKVTVYISNIFISKNENKSDDDSENDDEDEEDNDDEEDNIEEAIEKYKESANNEKQRIYKYFQRKYPNLDLNINSFEVIPGGPYIVTNKDPDHNNIDAQLYWYSIQEIISVFYKNKGKNIKANEIINLIEIIFNIINKIEIITDDFNLENFLKTYLVKSFKEFAEKQFNNKINKIKEDIKINFLQYIEILNNNEKAKESLNECFDNKNIELYKRLIPNEIKSFIDLSLEKYRKLIEDQIDKEFNIIQYNILSDENINSVIKDIINHINNAEFKEDVDMNMVNNIEIFWNDMYEKNKIILNYFKQNKPGILSNLKNIFISKIRSVFPKLLSKKILWDDYSEDKLITIQKEINNLYYEMLDKCKYQEDIEKYVIKNDIFYNNNFFFFKEKYFKNISLTRLNEIKEKIKNICQDEYNKILKNKLPSYINIIKDTNIRIKEKISYYLNIIFNKIQFRENIDPNLGTKKAFLDIIPLDIFENPDITNDVKNEINNIIENEIENAIKTFNNKKNQLPSFNQVAENIINKCTKLVDNKIKELINKFDYYEDKIDFNSDIIFSFIINNQDIYKDIGPNIYEIISKLRELCNIKSQEYEKYVSSKPYWSKIKSKKKLLINKICKDYKQKKFQNAYFRDDIKNINEEDLRLLIIENPDIYEGVKPNKMQEIENEIDEIIQTTINNIQSKKNSLPSWENEKNQIIQKAIIDMDIKSKNNLGSTDFNQVVNILVDYIENIPNFFDKCKTEEKKNEIKNDIKDNAKIISKVYINRKKEEEMKEKRVEESEKPKKQASEIEEENLRKQRIEERRKKEEKRRIEEEKRRIEEEKRRIEEEKRRRIEEEKRRIIEEEKRRNEIEGNRKRQMYFPATPYLGFSIVDGLKAIGSESSYGYRERIAARNGIGGYVGSPAQNTNMLNLLKQGNLLRP